MAAPWRAFLGRQRGLLHPELAGPCPWGDADGLLCPDGKGWIAATSGTAAELKAYAGQAIHSADEALTVASSRNARGNSPLPLKDLETALIRKAVEQSRGNVAQAAKALGISRATVYRKLR